MSIKKGGGFEREICKKLSLWYSKGKKDDLFWRTAGSGARATSRMKRNCTTSNSAGDVCALDKEAEPFISQYLIELKRGYNHKIQETKKKGKITRRISAGLSLTEIMDQYAYKDNSKRKEPKPPIFIRWMEKATKEAKQHNIPNIIIIFKRDRKGECIVLQYKTWEMLQKNNEKWKHPGNGPTATINYNEFKFVVLRMEDFFKWCDPKSFFKKTKTPSKKSKLVKRRR